MYFFEFLTTQTLKKYSIVNKTVKSHSKILNINSNLFPIDGTDSRRIINTLKPITTSSKTSNNLPAFVSASKIISWSFLFKGVVDIYL